MRPEYSAPQAVTVLVLSVLPTRLPSLTDVYAWFSSSGTLSSWARVPRLVRAPGCLMPAGSAPALPLPSPPLIRASPPRCTDTATTSIGSVGAVGCACSGQGGGATAPGGRGCAQDVARVTERPLSVCTAAPTPSLRRPPCSSQLLPSPPPRPPLESSHTLRAGRGRPRGGQRGWRGGRGLRLARAAAGGARRSPGRPPDTCCA